MAYLRPPALVRRVFNPIAMRLGMMGVQTLEVEGHRSASTQRVPVIPVELEGSRYLVSTRGDSEWVRNLRAAGAGRLHHKRSVEDFTVTEIDVADRPRIIDAYQKVAGRTVKVYFEKLPDPVDHPVFRIESRA